MPSRLVHRLATYAAVASGSLFIYFGLNAFLNPASALSFFEFALPHSSTAEHKLVTSLLAVYGARDVFMGAATYATAYYGNRKALGWVTMAGGAVAAVDGWVCYRANGGEMNHWGYAPMLGVVGAVLVA
ncbi:hypothetical protein JCM6882_006607 [Rhodosporidiobolus microsporus]